MSQETIIKWFGFAVWTLCLFGASAGYGHRQMKHWQDDWYAAHPVVKEVPPPIDDAKLIFWMSEDGAICREDSHGTNGVTCLHLERPRIGLCQGWAGVWWGVRPCPASAPQPQKSKKRLDHDWNFYYMRGYNAAVYDREQMDKFKRECPDMVFDGVTGQCEHPAQPLPEKEPSGVKWILCADPMDPHRLVPCPDLTAEEKCKWITDCAAPQPAEPEQQ